MAGFMGVILPERLIMSEDLVRGRPMSPALDNIPDLEGGIPFGRYPFIAIPLGMPLGLIIGCMTREDVSGGGS